jgi:hypothetical protein
LASSSGSVENLNVSAFQGLTPYYHHTAATAAWSTPSRGATSRDDQEQDNLRVALSTALTADPPLALQVATTTWRFWVNRGWIPEGARWLTRALDACPDRSALRARALAAMAILLIRPAKPQPLTAIGDEIVDVLDEHGDPQERAHAPSAGFADLHGR